MRTTTPVHVPAVFKLTSPNGEGGAIEDPAEVATGARSLVLARLLAAKGRLRTTKDADWLVGAPVSLTTASVWSAIQSLRDNGAITQRNLDGSPPGGRGPKEYTLTPLGRHYIAVGQFGSCRRLARQIKRTAAAGHPDVTPAPAPMVEPEPAKPPVPFTVAPDWPGHKRAAIHAAISTTRGALHALATRLDELEASLTAGA